MKQITSLTVFGLLVGSLSAQQVYKPTPSITNRVALTKAEEALLKKRKAPTSNTDTYAFFSPTDAGIDHTDPDNSGATFKGYVDPVFVDSTVKQTFGTDTRFVQNMKVGGTFDISSSFFDGQNGNPYSANKVTPFLIDSIWIGGFYNMQDPSVGDSLQIEICWGVPNSSAFLALSQAGPPVKKWVMPMNTSSTASGNTSFSTAAGNKKMVLTHIFTVADTARYTNPNAPYILVVPPSPIAIPAGNLVGIQYTYISKKPYTFGENYFTSGTNTSTMNSFNALIFQQADMATGGTGNDYFYDGNSNLSSGSYPNYSRYGNFTGTQAGLNGVMFPNTNEGYLWALSVHYTPNTGIAENSNDGTILSQNIPNPSNESTTIQYSLQKGTSVNFDVYDFTGNKVIEMNEGQKASGTHQIELNTANLAAGVYFYTLKTTTGASLMKKMVITK